MNAKADSCGNKLTRMLLDGKGQNLAAGFSRSEAALAFSSVSINDNLLEGMTILFGTAVFCTLAYMELYLKYYCRSLLSRNGKK